MNQVRFPEDMYSASGNPDLDTKALNVLSGLVDNALFSRSQLIEKYFDPRRDLDAECGYLKTHDLTADLYRELYDRDPIFARANDILPIQAFKVEPDLYEDEDEEAEPTDFELAFKQLGKSIRSGGVGESWYEDDECHPLWHYVLTLDKLRRVGRYGVMLLGFDDKKPLDKPVDGAIKDGGYFAGQQYYITFNDTDPMVAKNGKPPVNGKANGKPSLYEGNKTPEEKKAEAAEADKPEREIQTKRKLLYVRVYDESQAKVTAWESNRQHPRYGRPTMYQLTINDPKNNLEGAGQPQATVYVHWSRIHHVPSNGFSASSSEIIGNPRGLVTYNRIADLRKVYGADAEGYFRGAFMGISIETHPNSDAKMNFRSMKPQLERWGNTFQRVIGLDGATAKSIAPQVSDPTQHIDIQIGAICIVIGCPVRIFMGSERGELASSQDEVAWNEYLQQYRYKEVTPRLIVPLIDHLITVGVLPQPKKFSVYWPELDTMRPNEKADKFVKRMQGLTAYISGGGDTLIPPMDMLTREMEFTTEEAEEILANAVDHLGEAAGEDSEGPIVPGREPVPAGYDAAGNPIEEEDKDGEPMVLKPGDKAVTSKSGKEIARGQPQPKKITKNAMAALQRFVENNCGTGKGGFKRGNKCQTSGSGGRVTREQYINKKAPLSSMYKKYPHLQSEASKASRKLAGEKYDAIQKKAFLRRTTTGKLISSSSKHAVQRIQSKSVSSKLVRTFTNEIVLGRGPQAKVSTRVEAWGHQGDHRKPFHLSFKTPESMNRWASNNKATIVGQRKEGAGKATSGFKTRMKNRINGTKKFASIIGSEFSDAFMGLAIGMAAAGVIKYATGKDPTTNASNATNKVVKYFTTFFRKELAAGEVDEVWLNNLIDRVMDKYGVKEPTQNVWSEEARKKAAESRVQGKRKSIQVKVNNPKIKKPTKLQKSKPGKVVKLGKAKPGVKKPVKANLPGHLARLKPKVGKKNVKLGKARRKV